MKKSKNLYDMTDEDWDLIRTKCSDQITFTIRDEKTITTYSFETLQDRDAFIIGMYMFGREPEELVHLCKGHNNESNNIGC